MSVLIICVQSRQTALARAARANQLVAIPPDYVEARARPSASETWRQSPRSNLRCRRRGVVMWTGRMYLRATSTSAPACVKHRRAPRPVEARRLFTAGGPERPNRRLSSKLSPLVGPGRIPSGPTHSTGSACRTLRNQGDNPSLARCEFIVCYKCYKHLCALQLSSQGCLYCLRIFR